MESSTNLTNKNKSIGISNNPTSFSGSVSVGGNLVSSGNFGDYANLSYISYSPPSQSVSPVSVNNTARPAEPLEIDEEINQPIENNPPTSTFGEGCCSLKIGKLGCGSMISFWCFSLEPSAEDIYLVCCPKKSKEQVQQATKDSTNDQVQYQSTPQMEAQVQIDPK